LIAGDRSQAIREFESEASPRRKSRPEHHYAESVIALLSSFGSLANDSLGGVGFTAQTFWSLDPMWKMDK